MVIARTEALQSVDQTPERFDLEVLQYRLYLRQKIETAEEDIRAGRTLNHEEVVEHTAAWRTQ